MKKEILNRFKEHNFHDSDVVFIDIKPSNTYNQDQATVVLKVSDPDSKLMEITFKDCANLSLSADFDLLKDNSGLGHTSHSVAKGGEKYLSKIIRKIERDSNIEYEKMESPVDKKLNKVSEYISFEFFFFGGKMVVIAKDFSVKNISK